MKHTKYLKEIRKMADEEGVEQINFFYHKTRPTIQRKGSTYEIMGINILGRGKDTIEIEAIKIRPSFVFKVQYLDMDETWRKTQWEHVKRIIKTEIDRWNGR